MKAAQIVTSHQPHELGGGCAVTQQAERIDGVDQARLLLNIGHPHARMAKGKRLRRRQARRIIAMRRLEWIASRNDPPHPIELQSRERGFRNVKVSCMRRIKTSSKQPDPQT